MIVYGGCNTIYSGKCWGNEKKRVNNHTKEGSSLAPMLSIFPAGAGWRAILYKAVQYET
jgi:hypothetical protein